MATVTVERTVDAPLAKVWEAWDDFGNIARFNPNISASRLINNSADTGLDAQRQCDFTADGTQYIRERIIGYEPQKQLRIDIYEGTVPFKQAMATVDFEALGPERTRVRFTMAFTPKFGLFGALMVPMMKPKFAKMLGKLLDGNKAYVTNGTVVLAA